jgi:hypothetical protein
MYKLSPQRIKDASSAMADQLVYSKGVRATEADATGFAVAHGKAIMKGQVKGLEAYGIYLTKVEAKEYAALAKAGKLEEIHSRLMKLYKKAGGENAKAMKTASGRIIEFQKATKQLSQELGQVLLPVLADIADAWRVALPVLKPVLIAGVRALGAAAAWAGEQVKFFLDYLRTPPAVAAWTEFSAAFSDLGSAVMELGRAFGLAGPKGENFGTVLAQLVTDVMKDFAATARSTAQEVRAIASAWSSLSTAMSDFDAGTKSMTLADWGTMLKDLSVEWLVSEWNILVGLFQSVPWDAIIASIKNFGSSLLSALLTPINAVKDAWNNLINSITSFKVPSWVPLIGGKGFGGAPAAPPAAAAAAAVPGAQAGGVFGQRSLMQIAERGPEAVVPLTGGRRAEGILAYANRALGMGRAAAGPTTVSFAPNITINGNATMDEQRAMDTRLRDLARDFIAQFKAAQAQERRLSYESGYG